MGGWGANPYSAIRLVVLLVLIHCLKLVPMFLDFCVWSLFCNGVLGVFFSFVIILVRKKELLLYLNCVLAAVLL